MTSSRLFYLIAPLFILFSCASPQPAIEQPGEDRMLVADIERPIPYPLDIPNAYKRAQDFGTRTETGGPGRHYWQNEASYSLHAELDTENHRVHGTADIVYFNNSPDPLHALVVELAQNLHKEGTPKMETAEITGGKELTRIEVNGVEMEETTLQARWTMGASGYILDGTRLYIFPDEAVAADGLVELNFEWNFEVPEQGASGRMGRSRDNLYMIAYWYPQIAVYDDVYGWMDDSFLGNAEFYHKFAEYDLTVTAPREWIVMGTGELMNPEETLSPETLERYNEAAESDDVIVIADFDELGQATAEGDNGQLTWHFRSGRVRDVAFSATLDSKWESARAPVGDVTGDGSQNYTRLHTFYRETAPLWSEVTDYAQHSITFLSEYTGIPYPWPHMTSVEGADIIGGGMEFPMITLMGDYNAAGPVDLYGVTAHEFAHMWIPMIISTNERRYTWLDEGHTSFHTQQANVDRFGKEEFSRSNLFGQYLQFAGTDLEGEMMRWSDFHYPGPAYGVASYPKPASVLTALRGLLGEDLFLEAHREFMKRWEYKHPYPWDFFNTIEDVSGKDLSWFWRSWYYETWVLDQSVTDVIEENGQSIIVIEDIGNIPMPVLLQITLEDGTVLNEEIPVDKWLEGKRIIEHTMETLSPVISVVIDPEVYFPDADRTNNRWEAEENN